MQEAQGGCTKTDFVPPWAANMPSGNVPEQLRGETVTLQRAPHGSWETLPLENGSVLLSAPTCTSHSPMLSLWSGAQLEAGRGVGGPSPVKRRELGVWLCLDKEEGRTSAAPSPASPPTRITWKVPPGPSKHGKCKNSPRELYLGPIVLFGASAGHTFASLGFIWGNHAPYI